MDIAKITGIAEAEKDELLRWYARLNDTERTEIHNQKIAIFRQRRNELLAQLALGSADYAALILALKQRRLLLTAAERREPLTADQAAAVSKMRIAAVKTPRRRKEGEVTKLVRLRWFHEIARLRAEGLSWRQLADYFARHHKRRVSHTRLKECYEHEQAVRSGLVEGSDD